MLHHNSPDKQNLGVENSVVYRANHGASRVLMGVGPVTEENQQNYRIQQAVNRYNNVPPPLLRPSSLFKCNLLKSKIAKTANSEQSSVINALRSKPETRYAAGHFPTVILGKPITRQAKRHNILSHLRANDPILPVSRFLDDTSDKYTDLKNTRSVLDVLQDLSRKRIHGKDDSDDSPKRRCKGLGGNSIHEGESLYKPLFVPKTKNNQIARKDQTTQTVTSTTTGEAATSPADPKSELRRKLALKNNEIFASLSSSKNSAFFSKRKRVHSQIAEKETHSAKKQKVGEREIHEEITDTPPTIPRENITKKIESPRSPVSKDRLMNIYLDLKNAGDVKKSVLETLQKSPGESQFQRSVAESTPEITLPVAASPKITTPTTSEIAISKPVDTSTMPATPNAVKTNLEPAANDSPGKSILKPGAPQKDPLKSPEKHVTFDFNTKFEKSAPEKSSTTPEISFGFLNAPKKDASSTSLPTLKSSDSDEKSSPGTAKAPAFRFGEPKKDLLEVPQFLLNTSNTSDKTESPKFFKPAPTTTSVTPSAITSGTTATTGSTMLPFNFAAKKPDSADKSPPKLTTPSGFSFGQSVSVAPVTAVSTPPSFSFSKKSDTTDSVSSGFKFGATTAEPKTSLPPFSFGSPSTSNPASKPKATEAFTFGQPKSELTVADSIAPSSGQTKPESTTATAPFSFGQSKLETTSTSVAPAFSFGQGKPSGFLFGESKTDSPKAAFSLNQIKPAEPAQTTASSATVAAEPGFSFSQPKTFVSTDTPASSFGANKAAAPGSAPSQAFMFGQASDKPFSFGAKSNETPATPSLDKLKEMNPPLGPALFSFGTTSGVVKPIELNAAKPTDPRKPSIFGVQTEQKSASAATTEVPSIFGRLGQKISEESNKTVTKNDDSLKLPTADQVSKGINFTDAKPSSIFGSKPTDSTTSTIFGSAPVATSSVEKPVFSFGQNTTLTSPSAPPVTSTPVSQSGFSFGGLASTESKTPSFSFGKPVNASQPFTFGSGGNSTTFGGSATAPTTTAAPAFGSTTVAPLSFGASTTKPTFGATTTASSFGSATATPAFGATTATPTFGSASTSPAFGAPSATPTFGATTATPSFGSTTATPTFGSTTAPPAFGASTATPSFGATTTAPTFGTTTAAPPAFGSSITTPTFGSTSTAPLAFGTSTSTLSFGSTPSVFGSSVPVTSTPAFGKSSVASPTFGVASATNATPAFGATTTAPPSFASATAPAFGGTAPTFGTVAPAFGASTTSTFGSATTTAPPAFGSTSTTPAFGSTSSAFGGSAFSSGSATPSFGSGAFSSGPSIGFPATTTAPNFGGNTSTSTPQFGGFGATNATFGSPNNSTTGFGASFAGSSNSGSAFGSAPSTAGSATPFSFGAANAPSSTPTFKFGSNTNQNAPFTFGSNNSSGSGFNFSAPTPGGAFAFGSGNTSGFSQPSTPGQTAFQPGFGSTPSPGPFAAPATFSIGTATQSRRNIRQRRRP